MSTDNRGRTTKARGLGVSLGLLAASLAIIGGGASSGTSSASQLRNNTAKTARVTKLSVILGYLPSGENAGDAAAVGQGFYRAAGLDVTLLPGSANSLTMLDEVATGSVQIGQVSSSPSLIQAVAQGIPVQAFAAEFPKHPFAFYSLPSDPVRSVKGFLGKTIGTTPGANLLIDAALYKNGLARDIPSVNAKIITTSGSVAALLDHQVQIVTSWAVNTAQLAPLGKNKVQLLLWNTGVHLSAEVLFAKPGYIASHKPLLERYLVATARGWLYARQHPANAIKDLVHIFPSLSASAERSTLEGSLPYVFAPQTGTGGFGTINPADWSATIRMYRAIGQLKKTIPLSRVLNMSILNATARQRKV